MVPPAELSGFCHREYPRLVRALDLSCGDRGLAEELAQEALVRAARDWARVRDMDNPEGWLYRVAMNLRNSHFRRRGIERRAMARVGREPDPRAAADPAEVLALRAALATLPRRQREALVLRYFLDLPVLEAARTLGIEPGAFRQLCHRGITALRGRLDIEVRASDPASPGGTS